MGAAVRPRPSMLKGQMARTGQWLQSRRQWRVFRAGGGSQAASKKQALIVGRADAWDRAIADATSQPRAPHGAGGGALGDAQ